LAMGLILLYPWYQLRKNVHLDHFSNTFAGDVSCIEIIISLSSCTCIDVDRLLVHLHS